MRLYEVTASAIDALHRPVSSADDPYVLGYWHERFCDAIAQVCHRATIQYNRLARCHGRLRLNRVVLTTGNGTDKMRLECAYTSAAKDEEPQRFDIIVTPSLRDGAVVMCEHAKDQPQQLDCKQIDTLRQVFDAVLMDEYYAGSVNVNPMDVACCCSVELEEDR